jgi:phosphatidylinositol glycan class M
MASSPKSARTATSSSPPTKDTPSLLATFFHRPGPLYLSAALLRLIFLLYGLWQDANSPVKYTDIDYLVFTDAARFVSRGQSPYERETYRYTPILAWLLLPTAHKTGNPLVDAAFFSSGKLLFAAADLVAGWLLERVLARSMDAPTARKYAAIWLLNPMVATISTRGSSEGLLGVLVMALLSAVMARRVTLAGLLLGFGVHFKIYPFIYAPAIVWWMDREMMGSQSQPSKKESSVLSKLLAFITPARLQLAITSLATFLALNLWMYILYAPLPPPHLILPH